MSSLRSPSGRVGSVVGEQGVNSLMASAKGWWRWILFCIVVFASALVWYALLHNRAVDYYAKKWSHR